MVSYVQYPFIWLVFLSSQKAQVEVAVDDLWLKGASLDYLEVGLYLNPSLRCRHTKMLISSVVTLLAFTIPALAQSDVNETVWASVIYSYHGERTPLVLPVQNVLTPLGAQQLYSAGLFFRQRYIAATAAAQAANYAINGLLEDTLDVTQTYIMSTIEEFAIASAQAFMQGLYPPRNSSTRLDLSSILANGTVIQSPLGGYQYAQIYTVSPLDPNVIFLAGDMNCPLYDEAIANYSKSQEFLQMKTSTQHFYTSFQQNILGGIFPESAISYDNAYLIFDYLNYVHTHNQSIKKQLADDDLARARGLADLSIQAANGNTSVPNSIQTVAGKTLVSEIVALLQSNIKSKGVVNKISLLFGSFEPMVAFAALAQLPKANTDFYGIPDYGSSMVFEIYTVGSNDKPGYPNTHDLRLRFLFRNGTNSSSALTSYSLFDGSETAILSFNDFLVKIRNVALDSGGWCTACQSYDIFCAAFADLGFYNGSESTQFSGTYKHSMKPTVAGVIGAVIALVLVGITFAVAMLVGGIRLHRSKVTRRSALGGFKAGEKLASDQDLPRLQSGVGASITKKDDERVNSWELGEQSKPTKTSADGFDHSELIRKSSFEADDLGLHSFIKPTKIDERV